MLRNYLLVAVRNLLRNSAISFIHITGLGLGIAAFLLAIQTVIFEFSFDNFHPGGDRVFSISTTFVEQDGSAHHFLSSSSPALYHQISSQIPEVEFVTRYADQGICGPYCVMTYTDHNGKQKSYNELNARYVDEDFLKIFDFTLLAGARENVLEGNTSLVITQSIARKYFGDDNPIGKVLEVSKGCPESRQTKFTYQVTGVIEDVPANSSLHFDILLPFRNFEENYLQDLKNIWLWPGYFTFLKTNEIKDPASLTSKINRLVPEEEKKRLAGLNQSLEFKVQPFADFHFSVENLDSNSQIIITNSKVYMTIIGLIGLVILIVATVNYINLTTVKSLKRAKEVGIRKVVGASRSQLIRQFLLDTFLFNVLGFSFAITMLQIARPMIELWSGHSFIVFSWNYTQIALFLILLLGSTLLSGIIPAIFVTGVESARALKGISLRSSGGGLLRKILVIFQFVVSLGLIVFTSAIFLQVRHMQSKEKGFETNERIIIKSIGTEDFDFSKFRFFKDRIERDPKILGFTGAFSVPGLDIGAFNEYSTLDKPNERIRLYHNAVDFDFAKTMGLTIVAGREFTRDRMTSERVVMINESSVTRLGYETPDEAIGKTLTYHWPHAVDMVLKIIGVVKDFSSESPAKPILPEIFMFANTAWPYAQYFFFIVHVAPGEYQETIEFLEQEWKKAFPHAPFEYTFQDQAFQRVFERDERTKHIAGLSTFLALFIACMGLGGLVAYSVSQRQKEIGIRKTLGASVRRILILLSGDFVRLIFISMVLAIPIAWIAVNRFLENYEYRIQPSVWMFVIPCLLLLLIAIVTMGYQTMRAARSNPVEALKNE